MTALSFPWIEWPETKLLVAAFAEAGAEMRFVGGCARDALLGRMVQDVDAATKLLPEEVMALLQKAGIRAIPTGIDHGTVTAAINGKSFEITTLRKDVVTDGRHAQVEYTDDWKADASRRDFTINALYLSPAGELFDYFGGETDLREGRVRFIGDPAQRIREDYLRILRFFRFYAHYGRGEADGEALAACAVAAPHIENLSGERIRGEMLKLLAADSDRTLRLMQERGILSHALGYDIKDCEIFSRFAAIESTAVIIIEPFVKLIGFGLKSKIGPQQALEKIIARFKLSNHEARILKLLLAHQNDLSPDLLESAQKRLIRKLGKESFIRSVIVRWADSEENISKNHPYNTMLVLAETWQPLEFPVTGDDLIARGIAPGKAMGELLRRLEDQWEAGEYRATKEQLLAKAKE